jgi:hypothetical protein
MEGAERDKTECRRETPVSIPRLKVLILSALHFKESNEKGFPSCQTKLRGKIQAIATVNRIVSNTACRKMYWQQCKLQVGGYPVRISVKLRSLRQFHCFSGVAFSSTQQRPPSVAHTWPSAAIIGTSDLHEIWGSHGGENVHVGRRSCDAVWTYRFTDRRITLQSSALKMEAACSSEMLVSTYMSARRCHPHDHHRYLHISLDAV